MTEIEAKRKVQTICKRANPVLREHLDLNDGFLVALKATDPEVISDTEHEEINAIKISAKKTDKLLELLKKRSVKVYFEFMGVLKENDSDLYKNVKGIQKEVGLLPDGAPPTTPTQPTVPRAYKASPTQPTKPSQLSSIDQMVTDSDVQDIMDIFTISDLDPVYVRLGLKRKDIDNALEEANTPKKKATKVFNMWMTTRHDATRKKLLEAMKKVPDCRASMNELKKKWGVR